MNITKVILLSLIGLFSSSLYGQQNAFELQVGMQQIKVLAQEGSYKPARDFFTPRVGIHYYHRLNKRLGIKTGIQLVNQRIIRSQFSNFNTTTGLTFQASYDVVYDLLVINIPVNLRVDLNQGNPRFFIETGLALNMYWKDRIKFDFDEVIPDEVELPNFPKGFKNYEGTEQVGLLTNLSFGIRYDLNERSAVLLQPFSALDVSRIITVVNFNVDDYKEFPFHYGVQAGYTYFF